MRQPIYSFGPMSVRADEFRGAFSARAHRLLTLLLICP